MLLARAWEPGRDQQPDEPRLGRTVARMEAKPARGQRRTHDGRAPAPGLLELGRHALEPAHCHEFPPQRLVERAFHDSRGGERRQVEEGPLRRAHWDAPQPSGMAGPDASRLVEHDSVERQSVAPGNGDLESVVVESLELPQAGRGSEGRECRRSGREARCEQLLIPGDGRSRGPVDAAADRLETAGREQMTQSVRGDDVERLAACDEPVLSTGYRGETTVCHAQSVPQPCDTDSRPTSETDPSTSMRELRGP